MASGWRANDRPLKNEPSNASSTAVALEVVALLERGQDGRDEHVALKRPPRVQDARPHRLGERLDVFLKAHSAPQVFVEHDVQALAQVLADDRDVGLGHPREVRLDDPPGERRVAGAVKPLAQGPQGLEPRPQIRVAA